MMPNFPMCGSQSLEEGIRHLSSGDARIHAGGTDLLGCLRDDVFTAGTVVSMSSIKELKGIREERGGLRIGALVHHHRDGGEPSRQKALPWPCPGGFGSGKPATP